MYLPDDCIEVQVDESFKQGQGEGFPLPEAALAC